MAAMRAGLVGLLMPWLAAPAMADSFALIATAETYANVGPLKNPRNDGIALAELLRELGFSVSMTSDADLSTLREALSRLKDDAAEADDVLIFFAGHGVSVHGQSRLLPTDADISSRSALLETSMTLVDALAAVGTARRLGMVFSDACRNDPFLSVSADGSRSVRVLSDGVVADAGLGLPDEDEIASLEAMAASGGTYIRRPFHCCWYSGFRWTGAELALHCGVGACAGEQPQCQRYRPVGRPRCRGCDRWTPAAGFQSVGSALRGCGTQTALHPNPFRFRIVHRLHARLGGETLARDLDLVGRGKHVSLALVGAGHIAHADRAAEEVAVVA
jgi:hypothetical protein